MSHDISLVNYFYTSSPLASLFPPRSPFPSPSQSSLSRFLPSIASAVKYPTTAMPPNRPQASNSPFFGIRCESVKSPPERKGPTLRPAAEIVWAMPLRVPSVLSDSAEFVI